MYQEGGACHAEQTSCTCCREQRAANSNTMEKEGRKAKLAHKMVAVVIFSVCFVGFLVLMWPQFGKFINNPTTEAVSFEEVEKLKLPTMVFCDKRGFKYVCAK